MEVCKFERLAQTLPGKWCSSAFAEQVWFHSGQGENLIKLIYLPEEPFAWLELNIKIQILSCGMSMAADVATLLRIIWEQFFYYYNHHYHYFNLAIKLMWLSQHFQQIVIAWTSGGQRNYSCHHFYAVLGVNNLTTNMCSRMNLEWKGAKEKGGLLSIVFSYQYGGNRHVCLLKSSLLSPSRSHVCTSASQHFPWILALSMAEHWWQFKEG